MQRFLCLSLAVVLPLAAVGLVRAQDPPDPKAVIEKAIQAHGGAEKLTKYDASTLKGKGTFHGLGTPIEYQGQWFFQMPDKMKVVIDVDFMDQQFQQTQVFNGDKGWISAMGMTQEMDEEMVKETREQLYANRVETLVPLLKDQGFTLSPLGEIPIASKPAIGIRVSHKGHRDVSLYFDKASNLLVKSETVVKDLMAGGQEVTQETLYSDYKKVQEMPQPTKMVIKRDGKDFVDATFSEIQLQEKLDESVFAKP